MQGFDVSPIGRSLIERNEGCALHAYRDVVGVLTIGYGCTGDDVTPGMTITQAQADQMLSDRLARKFEPWVHWLVGTAPTTQGEFDAMVSLAFNIGVGAFSHSSVLHDHTAGNIPGAANAFLLWDKAGGRELPALLRRRHEERELYLSGRAASAFAEPSPRDTISDAQRRLNAWGIDPQLVVDGLFGPDTKDALTVFQTDRKLSVTGLPDAATLAALRLVG